MADDEIDEVLEELDSADSSNGVKVGDVIASLESRGYGPLLAVPAIVSISPIGAIPGASIVISIILVVISAQMAFGLRSPWIPRFIAEREIGHEKYSNTIDWIEEKSEATKGLLKPRLQTIMGNTGTVLIAVAVILLAITFIPLEVVPWGVVAPSFIVFLFGLALTFRDGVMAIIAWTLCPIWFGLFWYLVKWAA